MLATYGVLKKQTSSPQTSHYRSDDGVKHEAHLNGASGLRGFQGPVIRLNKPSDTIAWWHRRGTEAQGTRILPSKSPIFSRYYVSSCRVPLLESAAGEARGLSKGKHEESYCFLAVHMPRE